MTSSFLIDTNKVGHTLVTHPLTKHFKMCDSERIKKSSVIGLYLSVDIEKYW